MINKVTITNQNPQSFLVNERVETVVLKDKCDTVIMYEKTTVNVNDHSSNENGYQAIAGENLSGNRAVYINNGKAYYFDPTNPSLYGRCFGITTGAALMNDTVFIQMGGVMNWTAAPLTPNSNYYVEANGVLTNSPNQTVLQRVGHAIAPDKLKINFDLNIVTI
jgi:hypothetical protein